MDDKTNKDEEVQEEATDVTEAPVEVEETAPEVPENIPYQQPDLPGTPCPLCKGQGLDTRNQLCARCSGTGRII